MTRIPLFAVALAWPALAGAQLCDAPMEQQPLAASRDLYCMRLIPAPGIEHVVAHVELGHIPGPFTVTVTADGRSVYAPTLTVAGLPPAAHTTYVAWVAPPMMFPVRKLGVVTNGRTRLRPIDVDPFVVLVTAERSAAVAAPTGRLVLRGQSPSSRLHPADLLQFALGATSDTSMPMPMPSDSGRARWTMVPMPRGIAMLPSEMALRPTAAPTLPSRAGADTARPRQVMHLADGDTLHLTADVVERRIGDHTFTMYGYNGQTPGPLIEVHQGDAITVDFANHLGSPSSVHWHGIRLDNAFDGVDPIAPGAHFTYRVRFPDAGLYWYHPHVREDMQQNLGLYGNIIVRPRKGSAAVREEVATLDDLLLTDDGLVPYGQDAATHALMGRFGNVLMANRDPGYRLSVRRGEIVQFDLTNVANARVFNLSFPGARMKVIASDAGRFEHQEWVPSVVIAPAERYIVQVRFDTPPPGRVPLVNRVFGLDHLFGRFVPFTDTLGVVDVRPGPATSDRAFAVLHADTTMGRYRRYASRPADRTLLLTLETHDLPFVTRQLMRLDSSYFAPVEWTGSMPNMNWASTTDQVRWVLRDPATGLENMDIGWTFPRDTVIKLRLVNDRFALHGMHHPIHVHGQRFLILAVNGVPNRNLVWKDTVLVPAGSAVDILLELSNPGRWMLHCHIAEHLTAQMMTSFTVE